MQEQETKTRAPRKPWTAEDDATLVRCANLGANNLAVMLGRPASQIRNRAQKLRISLRQEGNKQGRRIQVTESA